MTASITSSLIISQQSLKKASKKPSGPGGLVTREIEFCRLDFLLRKSSPKIREVTSGGWYIILNDVDTSRWPTLGDLSEVVLDDCFFAIVIYDPSVVMLESMESSSSSYG